MNKINKIIQTYLSNSNVNYNNKQNNLDQNNSDQNKDKYKKKLVNSEFDNYLDPKLDKEKLEQYIINYPL